MLPFVRGLARVVVVLAGVAVIGGCGGGGDSTGPGTNKAPTIRITSPVNNATFLTTESITVTVDASDSDGTIAKVEMSVGSQAPRSFGVASFPASQTMAAGSAPTGTSKVKVVATDDKGATATDSITIAVNQPILLTHNFFNLTMQFSIVAPDNTRIPLGSPRARSANSFEAVIPMDKFIPGNPYRVEAVSTTGTAVTVGENVVLPATPGTPAFTAKRTLTIGNGHGGMGKLFVRVDVDGFGPIFNLNDLGAAKGDKVTVDLPESVLYLGSPLNLPTGTRLTVHFFRLDDLAGGEIAPSQTLTISTGTTNSVCSSSQIGACQVFVSGL
jgi:hypothetical protein